MDVAIRTHAKTSTRHPNATSHGLLLPNRERDGTREGRPETTLPVTIFNEYRKYKGRHNERGWTTQKTTADNLAKLRELAGNRQKWRDIVIDICDAEGS